MTGLAAKATMLIRASIAEVFVAFVRPDALGEPGPGQGRTDRCIVGWNRFHIMSEPKDATLSAGQEAVPREFQVAVPEAVKLYAEILGATFMGG